jgi:hypothetical protein
LWKVIIVQFSAESSSARAANRDGTLGNTAEVKQSPERCAKKSILRRRRAIIMRLKDESFRQFCKPVIKLWARLDNVVLNAIRGMYHKAFGNGTQLQYRSEAEVCVCFVLHQRDAYTYVLPIFDFKYCYACD